MKLPPPKKPFLLQKGWLIAAPVSKPDFVLGLGLGAAGMFVLILILWALG